MKHFAIYVAISSILGVTSLNAQAAFTPFPAAGVPGAGNLIGAGSVSDPNGARARMTPEERALLESGEKQVVAPAAGAGTSASAQPSLAGAAINAAAGEAAGATAKVGSSAAEQGFVDPEVTKKMQMDAAENEAFNSAYQRGEVEASSPRWSNPVSQDASKAEWVGAWQVKLEAAGVPTQKIEFEAGRLPSDLFEQWASRQIWAREDTTLAMRGDELRNNNRELKDGEVKNSDHNLIEEGHELKDSDHDLDDEDHELKDSDHDLDDEDHELKDSDHDLDDEDHELKDNGHDLDDNGNGFEGNGHERVRQESSNDEVEGGQECRGCQ
jgi:hypothetical protein